MDANYCMVFLLNIDRYAEVVSTHNPELQASWRNTRACMCINQITKKRNGGYGRDKCMEQNRSATMKKKIVNVVLFLADCKLAVATTLYVGQGAVSVMVYNFIFGVMVAIYVVGNVGRHVPDEPSYSIA